MARMLNPEVAVFADLVELSEAAADLFARLAREAVAARGRFTVALSGGRTPRELYQRLSGPYREQVPWDRVHLFWGDERYLPHNDPRSNCRMARENLVERVPIPADQVHPMPTHYADPSAAAQAYEDLLRAEFQEPVPVFDLILLGMGPDGHTASLFPGTPAVNERHRLVTAVTADVDPPRRLSLTLPVLTGAREVLFLVTGAEKRPVLEAIWADPAKASRLYPAALVADARRVTWYVDEAALGGC